MAIVGNLSSFVNTDNNEYLFEDTNGRKMIASEFDVAVDYTTGQFVVYGDKLYKFTDDHNAGAWIGTDAQETNVVSEMGDDISAKADKVDLSDAFDDTTDYKVGDLVIYNNTLYKCTTDHDAGAWVAGDFTATTIAENIEVVDFSVSGETLTISKKTLG